MIIFSHPMEESLSNVRLFFILGYGPEQLMSHGSQNLNAIYRLFTDCFSSLHIHRGSKNTNDDIVWSQEDSEIGFYLSYSACRCSQPPLVWLSHKARIQSIIESWLASGKHPNDETIRLVSFPKYLSQNLLFTILLLTRSLSTGKRYNHNNGGCVIYEVYIPSYTRFIFHYAAYARVPRTTNLKSNSIFRIAISWRLLQAFHL